MPLEPRVFQDIYVTAAVAFQPLGSLVGWLGLFQILSPGVAFLGHVGKYRGRRQGKRFHEALTPVRYRFVSNILENIRPFCVIVRAPLVNHCRW